MLQKISARKLFNSFLALSQTKIFTFDSRGLYFPTEEIIIKGHVRAITSRGVFSDKHSANDRTGGSSSKENSKKKGANSSLEKNVERVITSLKGAKLDYSVKDKSGNTVKWKGTKNHGNLCVKICGNILPNFCCGFT
jgi:hypothetical protein